MGEGTLKSPWGPKKWHGGKGKSTMPGKRLDDFWEKGLDLSWHGRLSIQGSTMLFDRILASILCALQITIGILFGLEGT